MPLVGVVLEREWKTIVKRTYGERGQKDRFEQVFCSCGGRHFAQVVQFSALSILVQCQGCSGVYSMPPMCRFA